MTDEAAELDALRAELLRCELALAARDGSGIEGGVLALLADDFVEFGTSGRAWDLASIAPGLTGGPAAVALPILDFAIDRLAPDVVLATYRSGEPKPGRRSSVWVRRDGRWRMRFHQGTAIPRD